MIGPVVGLVAQMTVTFNAADRSEARLRSIPPAGQAQVALTGDRKTAVDLSTTPTASLTFAWPNFEFGLGYAVGISKIDVQLDNPVLVYHSGHAAVSWWNEELRFTLSQDASYGHTSFVGLPPAVQLGPMQPAAPPTLRYVPVVYDLKIGTLRTAFAASYRIDAQWTTSASVFYEVAGGIDDASQEHFPRRRGPGAEVTVTYAPSAIDELSTHAGVTITRVARTGGDFLVIPVTETWGHRFSEQTRSTVGGGITYVYSRPLFGYTYGFTLLPTAHAGISHTIPLERDSSVTLTAATSLGTGFNAVAGLIQYSISGTVGADWTNGPFTVGASLSTGHSLPMPWRDEPPGTGGVTGSLVASYTPVEFITFETGARTFWFFSDDPNVPNSDAQWAVFAAVTIRAPPLRF
jgi:hypothetical protein